MVCDLTGSEGVIRGAICPGERSVEERRKEGESKAHATSGGAAFTNNLTTLVLYVHLT